MIKCGLCGVVSDQAPCAKCSEVIRLLLNNSPNLSNPGEDQTLDLFCQGRNREIVFKNGIVVKTSVEDNHIIIDSRVYDGDVLEFHYMTEEGPLVPWQIVATNIVDQWREPIPEVKQ